MSTERLGIEPSFGLNGKSVSAPSSADFYFEGTKVYETPKRNGSKRTFIRGRHEKPVPTLESGLVDFDGLEIYLHPNPNYVPLKRTRGWKYHHVNHPESSFKQWEKPLEERNPRLVALRNSSYQQVKMRITSEIVYHNAHEINVPHPPTETVDMVLRDFERLDMLGAACLYLNLSRGDSQYRVDNGSLAPPWAEFIPQKDRLNFISEVREDNARSIVRAEVLPSRLVTSALKRLSIHLGDDPYLTKMANSRLASDPVFYPVRAPSHKTLLNKANRILELEFITSRFPFDEGLQTGVDQVELAA